MVTGTSGNASGYDVKSKIMFIKPNGFSCENLKLKDLVGLDLDGNVIYGSLAPSIDTSHHLLIYQRLPAVGGIVHTHSTNASAFAACELSIPVYLTSVADLFGGEIPCTKYVSANDDLGAILVEIAARYSSCLVAWHGVFAFGRNPAEALFTAKSIEDAAKTVHLALQLGAVEALPSEEIVKWRYRHTTKYGQH